MNLLENLLAHLKPFAPLLAAVVLLGAALWIAHWLLIVRAGKSGEAGLIPRQLSMILLSGVGLIVIVLVLPVSETLRNQLLILLGILGTGVIGLASTTLVANAMAGLMLRTVKSFRPGDFVRIGTLFGRVTERGLFHVEIQTEDRDLTTLPNLYLITNPVTVVRSSGTIVSATLSLGYDVAHSRVEPLLVEAARKTGLEDSFVRILELGNFAVTYRVSGFLVDVKQLLTVRSRLKANVLDELHGHDIEIMSPNFMAQRRVGEQTRMVPDGHLHTAAPLSAEEAHPEEVIFDKADEAERLERCRVERDELKSKLAELDKEIEAAPEEQQAPLEARRENLRRRLAALEDVLNRDSGAD